MKKNLSFALPILLLMACSPEQKEGTSQASAVTPTLEEIPMPDSVLRHVVLFGFKETASAADVQSIVDAFLALPPKISEVKDFEWGINSSPEGLNQGLTHAFTLTFHSEADRDAYLPHPAHQEFVALLGPHLDKVTVLDYWTK
jgi:hypothetical protein